MAEENEDVKSEDKETKKTNSRKFVVWLVWIFMALVTLAAFIISMAITKQIPDSLVNLVENMLKYAFVISCEYIGVNVLQKGFYAIKDIFGTDSTASGS